MSPHLVFFIDGKNLAIQYDYNNLGALSQLATLYDGSATRNFAYDARGNVINNGKRSFDFNKAQQITTSGSNTYVYDGHGRRVKRVSADLSSTDYSFYSKDGKLLYREKDGQPINYIFLGKQQVARVDADTQYIHTDNLGSPVVETNSNGAIIANTRMHYRPFGVAVQIAVITFTKLFIALIT